MRRIFTAFLCTKKTRCHAGVRPPNDIGLSWRRGCWFGRPTGRLHCTPKGIRTPVAGLKGLSPSPLDDGGVLEVGTKASLPETGVGGQMQRAKECILDWGWEQSGGEAAPGAAGAVYRLWARRSAGARPGRTGESVSLGGCEGRHKGEERVERSEERVTRSCLSKIGSGTGGTRSGWTPSIRHLLRISPPGR